MHARVYRFMFLNLKNIHISGTTKGIVSLIFLLLSYFRSASIGCTLHKFCLVEKLRIYIGAIETRSFFVMKKSFLAPYLLVANRFLLYLLIVMYFNLILLPTE